MSNNNPYSVVQGPNYGAGLMNWSQLGQLGGSPDNKLPTPAQAQAGASAPNNLVTPAQAQAGAAAPGSPSQAQQQVQGLGQRLMAMLGLSGGGQQPQAGQPMSLAPPTQPGAAQPSVPANPASPYGLY
jgi:hypothetical protein